MKNYPSSIAIDQKDQITALFNKQLADIIDLHSYLKQAHWNVKGIQFYALHELFEKLSVELWAQIDVVAERITTLGGVAKGSFKSVAKTSRLEELPDTFDNGEFTIKKLVEYYIVISSDWREAIDVFDALGDKVSADIATVTTAIIEKQLWKLESHLI